MTKVEVSVMDTMQISSLGAKWRNFFSFPTSHIFDFCHRTVYCWEYVHVYETQFIKVTIIINESIQSWLFNLKYLKVFFAGGYFKSKIISEYCINTVILLMTLKVNPLLSLLWQWNKKRFNAACWRRSVTQLYVTAAVSTRELSPLSGWENVIGRTDWLLVIRVFPCLPYLPSL